MEEGHRFHLSFPLDDLRNRNEFPVFNGTLQSSFPHAVNYAFYVEGEERIFTILWEGASLLPDSLILSKPLFKKIKASEREPVSIQKSGFQIEQTNINMASEYAEDLFLPHLIAGMGNAVIPERFFILQDFLHRQEKKSALFEMPEHFTRRLAELADALLREDGDRAKAFYMQLVGAGKGLTPACDDAMTGIFSVVCAYIHTYPKYESVVSKILEDLCGTHRTTKISEKYLKCACRGMFSYPLLCVLAWMMGQEQDIPKEALVEIVQTGHTSGMDTLYGIQIAAGILAG